MLLRGLTLARFDTWPDEERAAVREALRAMLVRAVTGDTQPSAVAVLVCAAANIGQDLAPWLGSDALHERLHRLDDRDTLIAIAEL